MNKYKVVIHTNKYAGNFERDLTAHLVGVIGDCEVGREYIQGTYPGNFEFIVEQRSDEDGIRRPCGICPIDNSLLSVDEIKQIWQDAIDHNTITYEGYIATKIDLIKRVDSGETLLGGWDRDSLNAEITRRREDISQLHKQIFNPNMTLHYAVEIYFIQKPSSDEFDFIKKRLSSFECRDTPKFLRMDIVEEVYTENVLESIMIGN